MDRSDQTIRKQEIEALWMMIDLCVPDILDPKQAQELKQSVRKHYDRCPKMNRKPFCAKCASHCFSREESEQIRLVMKKAGMKMFLRHPLICLRHLKNDLHLN